MNILKLLLMTIISFGINFDAYANTQCFKKFFENYDGQLGYHDIMTGAALKITEKNPGLLNFGLRLRRKYMDRSLELDGYCKSKRLRSDTQIFKCWGGPIPGAFPTEGGSFQIVKEGDRVKFILGSWLMVKSDIGPYSHTLNGKPKSQLDTLELELTALEDCFYLRQHNDY